MILNLKNRGIVTAARSLDADRVATNVLEYLTNILNTGLYTPSRSDSAVQENEPKRDALPSVAQMIAGWPAQDSSSLSSDKTSGVRASSKTS
jgi:hypothetical protein